MDDEVYCIDLIRIAQFETTKQKYKDYLFLGYSHYDAQMAILNEYPELLRVPKNTAKLTKLGSTTFTSNY